MLFQSLSLPQRAGFVRRCGFGLLALVLVLTAVVLPLNEAAAQGVTPAVSFGGVDLSVVEGSDDTFRAVLNLNPAPTADITLRVETEQSSPGRWSAAEGSDYTAASIDVPVANGVNSVFVEFSKSTTSGVPSAM